MSVLSLSSEYAVMFPVAVKLPDKELPFDDKLPNPTSDGESIVQLRVTVPEVPPPDIPVPATTPVISPGLDVALIVTVLVAGSVAKLTLVPGSKVIVSSLFSASKLIPSKLRCLKISCDEPLSAFVRVTVPEVQPPDIPAPAVTPWMSPVAPVVTPVTLP